MKRSPAQKSKYFSTSMIYFLTFPLNLFINFRVLSYAKFALQPDISVPDELLYGRAGYLHALLFIRKHFREAVPDTIVKQVNESNSNAAVAKAFSKYHFYWPCLQVVRAIIDSGRKLSSTRYHKEGRMPPLQFEWHDKEYVGAAHGYCGILSTLLMVSIYEKYSQFVNCGVNI